MIQLEDAEERGLGRRGVSRSGLECGSQTFAAAERSVVEEGALIILGRVEVEPVR